MNIKIDDYRRRGQDLLVRFQDIRFTGQVVFVVIVLLISWSGVKSIQTNYNLQKQISTLRQQSAVQKLQNDNLALQNQYFNSNEYLELSARQNFGLARPGEKEILVPASVALAYAPALPSAPSIVKSGSGQVSNFRAWINFFLHRQTPSD